MAILAIIRRIQRPMILFSRVSRPLSLQPPSPINYFSQAFHQTTCRHTPHIDSQKQYQIFDFAQEAHEGIRSDVGQFLERVQKAKDFASGDEAIAFLDHSGVKPDKDFIFSAIWALREEWKLAFLVFKWSEKWDCVGEKTWCLMIWLLGNHRKFSTAWTVIHELYHASKDTQQAMLIMIDRYAAANLPGKAIETFHLMQKFRFSDEQRTYFIFLNILCNHGNMEEAEEFMFLNKRFFPLETQSFNIILNAWCNIAVDICHAKRIWREMSKCCIEPDATSYTHIISGHSRARNLCDALRLYDQMKRKGWIPGLEVYHSLIYVLAHENCLGEALKLVDTMKETGLEPSSTTYNLVIRPLCQNGKFEEATAVLTRMTGDGIRATTDTYHALLNGGSLYRALAVLNDMREAGVGPGKDTFVLVLKKCFRMGEAESAMQIWAAMGGYEVEQESAHYNVLVEGLAKCGLLDKAREYYSVGVADDPTLRKLLEEPVRRQVKIVRYVGEDEGLQLGSRRKR